MMYASGRTTTFLKPLCSSDCFSFCCVSRVTAVSGGTREEVEWQSAKAAELGFAKPSSLDYQETLGAEESSFRKVSVLPSKTVEVIRALNGARFIARAGNGIIYHCGAFATDSHERPTKLEQRLKNEFDPKHILPDLPL